MSLADDIQRFQARLLANAPSMAANTNSLLMNIARAFLAAKGDSDATIASVQPEQFIDTASWAGLLQLAANYGVTVDPGSYASGTVTFSLGGTPAANYLIPAGTVLSTEGDNISVIPSYFVTQADAILTAGGAGQTAAVAILAQSPGVRGNVSAHTITVIITQGLAATFSCDNAAPTSGGTDGDTVATLQNKLRAAIRPKYSQAAIEAAARTVAALYDVYAYDPQDGTGTLTIYNADVGGAVLTGAALTALQAAVGAVLPPGIHASAVTYPAFTTVDNITAMALSYSAPATVQAATIEPQIKAAVQEYVQGNPAIGYPGLQHGQVPTVFGLVNYVQQKLGYVLTNLVYTSSTPTIVGAVAANTTLWRMSGTPAITLTRV